MITYLITGITLGFAAGISPGPLLVMVITETIKYDKKQGIKMALVPLVSDLPIVLFSVFVVYKISNSNTLLSIIAFLGAIFLIYLAFENIKIKKVDFEIKSQKVNGFWKGVIANFLSPHPYLFWMLVGAPISIRAYHESFVSASIFMVGFYFLIVSTKIVVAFISEKSKNIFSGNTYVYIVKGLGFILIVLAVVLIKDGVRFLSTSF